MKSALFSLLLLFGLSGQAWADRVKDLASVAAGRTNQLIGYGLVVGLDGTGDQTTQMPYTTQSLANYLQQMGISLPPGQRLQPKMCLPTKCRVACWRAPLSCPMCALAS